MKTFQPKLFTILKNYNGKKLVSDLVAGLIVAIIALPLSILTAVIVLIVLEKTKFGFELKATGFNKNAAKYCGMAEKRNIIVTLMISGAIAALGASFLYLTDDLCSGLWQLAQPFTNSLDN